MMLTGCQASFQAATNENVLSAKSSTTKRKQNGKRHYKGTAPKNKAVTQAIQPLVGLRSAKLGRLHLPLQTEVDGSPEWMPGLPGWPENRYAQVCARNSRRKTWRLITDMELALSRDTSEELAESGSIVTRPKDRGPNAKDEMLATLTGIHPEWRARLQLTQNNHGCSPLPFQCFATASSRVPMRLPKTATRLRSM